VFLVETLLKHSGVFLRDKCFILNMYGNQTKKIKKDVNFSMSFFYLLLLNSNERDQFLS
jgi:hypothetical protein